MTSSTQFQSLVIASDGRNIQGPAPATTGSAVLDSVNTADGSLMKIVDATPAFGTLPLQFNGGAFAATVPEPSTIALTVSGLVVIAAGMRSRRKATGAARPPRSVSRRRRQAR